MRELVFWCMLIVIATSTSSYRWGYSDATAKADADKAWVNQQMEKAGFCAWVRQSSFANHCASSASSGGDHE